jgi:3'-5' exoribonuclease
MIFKKSFPINTLKEGDKIKDIFVVKFKKGVTEYSKGYSMTLTLTDSSGKNIEYKYWGDRNEAKIRELYDSIKQDAVILVNGTVSTYMDKQQLISDSNTGILIPLLKEQYESAEFIMLSKKDLDILYSELNSKIESIKNPELKKFINEIFEETGEKFKIHPGAIQIHHNWIGGLLEHTLEVIEYCETSFRLYPDLDHDLLIAGAILHDIGKLEELVTTSRIKGSEKGQLIGHLALGIVYLSEKFKKSDIDELTKNKLMHMLVSSHGKTEYGSPKEPMIPEAMALYYADESSSKISEMILFIKEAKDATEDDFMYNSKKGHNIFLK